MQYVTAFSSPQTVRAAPAAPLKAGLWILDSWRDLILYVCTPLVILPIFLLAQARWSAQDIYLFVAAFGAMGHHLPGMIRAYGDRALFQRFKWRFIFAPVFLVVVCAAFSIWDLKGIVLVAFVWGCLARHDADLRVLPYLRRESRFVRRANAPFGFRIMRHLVCYCGSSVPAANDRYTRDLLFRRWTFHPACASPKCAARVTGGGDRSCGTIPCKLRLVVDPREPTKPGEAGASHHEHIFLVVLQ